MIDEIDGIIEEFNEKLPAEYTQYITPMQPTNTISGSNDPNWNSHEPNESINVKSGDLQEMEMKYPDLIEPVNNNNNNNNNNNGINNTNDNPNRNTIGTNRNKVGELNPNELGPEQWPRQGTAFKQFDDNFPTVVKISIEGTFFTKYPLVHIEYEGYKFTRKLKHFKWLWRML